MQNLLHAGVSPFHCVEHSMQILKDAEFEEQR